ncbi:DUF3943 domain-containing protein [Halobacteriovorax sp. HLS]|uniref:DUF3943 domain-containing protein n=1 Tax=Halobacteriovorax sp. HLS TaxID=2234000 RepID=UPI000FD9E315|nr:DUF3943 domain-containing protein [Halobacteriovorax sp. HLS]
MNFKSMLISTILLSSVLSTSYASEETFRFEAIDYTQPQKRQLEEGQIDPWLMNPISRYMDEHEWNEMTTDMHNERVAKEKRERMFGRGKVVTIDTRDTEKCSQLQNSLKKSPNIDKKSLSELCIQDEQNPYSSIIVVDGQYRMPISLDGLTPEQQRIAKQTRNFTALGAAAVGLLWMLPESVTKWDKEEISNTGLGDKWKENVKAGPVVDEDEWMINYIGHPISGAAYYTVARHAGLNKMESFGYSVFMSTVFWEYGFEAVAETPSIQDLLITPIIGSLMGEAMYQMEENIRDNGGVLLGSKKLGGFAMALMNPAGAMLDGINNVFENRVFESARTYIYTQPGQPNGDFGSDGTIGIGIEFKF